MDSLSVVDIALGVGAGNLLTVMFVYSAVQWSKRERTATESEPGGLYLLLGMLFPLAMVGIGVYLST